MITYGKRGSLKGRHTRAFNDGAGSESPSNARPTKRRRLDEGQGNESNAKNKEGETDLSTKAPSSSTLVQSPRSSSSSNVAVAANDKAISDATSRTEAQETLTSSGTERYSVRSLSKPDATPKSKPRGRARAMQCAAISTPGRAPQGSRKKSTTKAAPKVTNSTSAPDGGEEVGAGSGSGFNDGNAQSNTIENSVFDGGVGACPNLAPRGILNVPTGVGVKGKQVNSAGEASVQAGSILDDTRKSSSKGKIDAVVGRSTNGAYKSNGSRSAMATNDTSLPAGKAVKVSKMPSNNKNDYDLVPRPSTPPLRTKPKFTYSSPRKGNSSPASDHPETDVDTASPLRPNQSSSTFSTPRKPAKDLSQIFDFSSSPAHAHSPSQGQNDGALVLSNSNTPTRGKMSKRMLSRTKTEPAVGSPSVISIGSSSQDSPRTSSMPTMHVTPTRPRLRHRGSTSVAHASSSQSQPATTTTIPTVPRTYSGKSRSFLIAVPSSQYGITQNSLSELPGLDEAVADDEDIDSMRESYTSLRERWGVDESEDDPRDFVPPDSPGKDRSPVKQPPLPSLPPGMMNDLKSISELRSKGENRRFLDEVGYLFEGLSCSGSIGLRRSSALEIVKKLCDTEFSRKAKAAEFYVQTLDLIWEAGAGADKILALILVAFTALISRDSASLTELVQRSLPSLESTSTPSTPSDSGGGTLVSFLCDTLASLTPESDILTLISRNASPAELKRAGVGRADKVVVQDTWDVIVKKASLGLGTETDVSTSLLITYILARASPADLFATRHLSPILDALQRALEVVKVYLAACVAATTTDMKKSATQNKLPLSHIANCLKLLDSFLLNRWSPEAQDVETPLKELLVADFVELALACDVLERGCYAEESEIAYVRECMELCYTIMLSLTHDEDDDRWCTIIIQKDGAMQLILRSLIRANRALMHKGQVCGGKVKKEEDDEDLEGEFGGSRDPQDAGEGGREQALDRLCLSLGLFTNLAQGKQRDDFKKIIRHISLNNKCPLPPSCILQCSCPPEQHITAPDILVALYIDHNKSKSREDEDTGGASTFVLGHIVILLGLLMRDSRSNQEAILKALPGSSREKKISGLVEQAREFVELYEEVVGRIQGGVIGDGESGEYGRVVKDKKGCKTARGVVEFLERLGNIRRW